MNAPDRLADVEQTLANLVARVALLERASAKVVPSAKPAVATRGTPSTLETTLGTYWLSRIGIVSLITGAALLVITYFGALGPLLRVALGYAMAAVLAWAGLRLARRHQTFGRVVFAGGLAIGYFVTYALHFVPAMRIVDSEPISIVLIALAIAGIVAIAHRMRSETVAGVALFLGLHTGMLSDVTALSLVCTTLLAAGAGFFLAANRWVIVPFSTVIAVYTTHATLAHGDAAVGPTLELAFLAIDFALFAGASLVRADVRAPHLVGLALINWLGLTALGGHALHASQGALFAFLAAVAIVHATLGVLAAIRKASPLFVAVLFGLAIVTLAAALHVYVTGWPLVGGWIALAVVTAAIARRAAWPAFGWVGLALLAATQGYAHLVLDGAAPQVACVLAWFATERLFAARDRATVLRCLLIAGVALALVRLGVAGDLHALAWVAAAFLLFATGFALRSSPYRWSGFAVLGLAALQFFSVELGVLSATQRIATFVIAGVLLLVVSFVYTRIRGHRAPPA